MHSGKFTPYLLQAGYLLIITLIGITKISGLSLIAHVLLTGSIIYFFYGGNNAPGCISVLKGEAFLAVVMISKAFSIFFIDALLKAFRIIPGHTEILIIIQTAFASMVLLYLYYFLISQWGKKRLAYSGIQYTICFTMFLYSTANLLAIAEISCTYRQALVIFPFLTGFVVLANLFLLYCMEASAAKNHYRLLGEMMKQQEALQYQNLAMQKEQYHKVTAMLHDIKKHMRMAEALYHHNLPGEAAAYTGQVRQAIHSLAAFPYTNNSLLNCLLADTKRTAEKLNILFEIEVTDVDIYFMEPLSITTLFANLLDNAIAASKKCQQKRYVGLMIQEYNDIISIRVKNSVALPVPIRKGKISKYEGDQKGIGLINIQHCVDQYDGNMIYKYSDGFIICDIILNKTDQAFICSEGSW